ncbi:hypothetical protein CDD82_569 [Ophiocordyceps australis]|uniref:Uncharacterized protein n=1 Tax=Ophiocordyceps australis TaxID=1399860 RepID=A0A2C5YL31_9HYPO|nr:hypothetical protein CDD82_569 [Ophiocordyceps australis]
MSVLQLDELVLYQLRTSYLDEIADGVGERLIAVDESFLNSAPFKSAGWRPNSSHIKRTHSPPIPTAVASEYFQAPRQVGHRLEDGEDDGGLLTGGGADTMGPGMATKRRRRREQMDEDDSSDLSDDSDDESEQRAAQQIKFSKMPVRQRAGSSPLQSSHLMRQQAQTSPRAQRRGSQSALEVVKERARRDTVTSSEVSSENEVEASVVHRHREAARALRLGDKIHEEPGPGLGRSDTTLLPEEEEDDDTDEGSDMTGSYVESIDSASMLAGVDNPINPSPMQPVVGTPPRNFTRQPTIRKSQAPLMRSAELQALPPPRPMSMMRPLSVAQPQSLLSAALRAKQHKSQVPFQKFAHYSAQGTQGSINLRIYASFSQTPDRPYEVLIQPRVHDGQGAERVVTVADLIGLSLYRYNEDKREPPVAPDKRSVNWWTLRMVDEGGEVDHDFPPFERTKPLAALTTVNSANGRAGGRMRANSTAFDEFALVPATEQEHEVNKLLTPQEEQGDQGQQGRQEAKEHSQGPPRCGGEQDDKQDDKQDDTDESQRVVETSRPNPIITTTWRPKMVMADAPQAPVAATNTQRGQQKLLRIHIMSADAAPGQMVTLDVTTDTYLAEVLDVVCRKRQLDKGSHVLKLPVSGAVVIIDRPVSSIGNISDLELYRRRFATDGPLSLTTGSPSSSSPRPGMALAGDGHGAKHHHLYNSSSSSNRKGQQQDQGQMLAPHPLAREALKQEELGNANYKRYTVWRKQPMRIVGMSERVLVIDGEYIHISAASGGKSTVHDGGGKTTTVHFSNVIGCKVPRKHPANVKLVIYRATESKRYDFEAKSADEAAEIVAELKKGISPYRDV